MGYLSRLAGIARSLWLSHGIPLRAGGMARLYRPFVPQGGLCFDIGAHLGNRVRCWRRLGARVVAVEPQPDMLRVLAALFSRDPGVTLVALAVGREVGTARLWVSERHPTVSSLSADWIARVSADPAFRAVHWDLGPEVRVITLDRLIADHGLPAFIKLDIEGLEADALAGLSHPVAALSFEYLPPVRAVALDCIEILERLGAYRYNYSVGESHRLSAEHWLDGTEIRRFLAGLAPGARSGDIYARLGDSDDPR